MYYIADREKDFAPLKSGFKTAAQADHWAKKNLPKDEVLFWNKKPTPLKTCPRYFVRMK